MDDIIVGDQGLQTDFEYYPSALLQNPYEDGDGLTEIVLPDLQFQMTSSLGASFSPPPLTWNIIPRISGMTFMVNAYNVSGVVVRCFRTAVLAKGCGLLELKVLRCMW